MQKILNLIINKCSKTIVPRILGIFVISLIPLMSLTGCATQVERVEVDTIIDLSGAWNDVDSRQVSQALTTQMLEMPWYRAYTIGLEGRTPVMIVGSVRNNSNDQINTETFTKDLELAAINSGLIDVVAARNQVDDVRLERLEQQEYASLETRKALREEFGADLILLGSINSIDDVEGRRSVRYYQVDAELIDIESNRKLWIGQDEIKKFIRRAVVRP